MTGHRPRRHAPASRAHPAPASKARTAPAGGTGPVPAILVAAVSSAAEADEAISAGADMIDGSGLTGRDLAALRARHPGLRLWHGSPAAADGDNADDTRHTDDTGLAGAAADTDPARSTAAVVARVAVLTWLGTPAIRTRHVLPARRAIDMTCAIAGTRLPAFTTRGLG